MSYSRSFRLFTFTPQKLMEERMTVETRFKGIDQEIIKKRRKANLPILLDKIRKAKLDQLDELIKNLLRIEFMILLYDYPFQDETHETKQKINYILANSKMTIIGRTAWELYQQNIHDNYVAELLHLSYQREEGPFLNFDQPFQNAFDRAIGHELGLVDGLIASLGKMNLPFRQWSKGLKIKEGTMLENKLSFKWLERGLPYEPFIKLEGSNTIKETFNKLPMDKYKALLHVYLENRTHKEYNPLLLEQAIRKLKDPRDDREEWSFTTESNIEKVKRWLFGNELKKFFENDTNSKRFDYWKRYIDYMENVTPLKNPFVAFIYFKNFVVVEFGNIGAAYFYHKEGFEKYILPRTKDYRFINYKSTGMKESMLKDITPRIQGTNLFIQKLAHQGNWQKRFERQMQVILGKTFK